MLPLAERLSLYPAETLLAVPLPPEQAVRGVLVLGGITRQLEDEAAALRDEQRHVEALQHKLGEEAPKLTAAEATRARQAMELDAQISTARETRQAAEDAAAEAAKAAAAAAARADGLRAAIARIEAKRSAAAARARAEEAAAERQKRVAAAGAARHRQEALARPAGPGIGESHGQLTAPVAGVVVRSFGDLTEGGPAAGMSYQATPGARVVSPCGGRIVFAGPFRSFGLLLIVDCGGGYHFVLAGFDRLDVQVGQPIQPGEPVGVMPAAASRSTGARPTLYMELRRAGEPVNPAPFLRARG
jgi:septal ring factor EnvC (AmiA/AmiB activator)